MLVYHGSPNKNIKKLRKGSYVSMFPHVAYFMGMFYTKTGNTWVDDDLSKPYGFEDKIYFKKNMKPDGIPNIYVVDINMDEIEFDDNFPFEFRVKVPKKTKEVVSVKSLLEKSKKMFRLMDDINY